MKDYNPNHKNLSKTQVKQKTEIGRSKGKLLFISMKSILTLIILSLVVYCFSFVPAYLTKPIKPQFINISGNRVLTSEAVLDYLPIYKNTRWFDLDTFELSRLLTEHSWIEKANVHRRPNLGIDIKIVEVNPVAFLKAGDELYLVSNDLQLLSFEKSGVGRNLPVIVNDSFESTAPGDYLPLQTYRKAINLIKLLKNNPTIPLQSVSEINITDPLNMVLVLMPNAVRLKLGSDGFEEKLLNLGKATDKLINEGSNIRYIDLRYKKAVVFRRKI